MKFLFYIYFRCLINVKSMYFHIKKENVFKRHYPNTMGPILENLHNYSINIMRKSEIISTKDMYIDFCQNIREGQYHLNKELNDTIYLGWTPLINDTRTNMNLIQKNTTFLKPEYNHNMGTSYKNIPLYYIYLKKINSNNTIIINKIIRNPTIYIELNLFWLKDDLIRFCNSINTTLDTNNKYDERWKLIWSGLF